MIPELGQFALILALLLACVQCVLPIVGASRGNAALMAVARPAVAGQAVFIVLAFAILTYAFVTQDFSVAYVAQNSNLALPWYYRFSAVWGAHEGSLLLWLLILNIWSVAVAACSRKLPDALIARVLGVMGFIAFGFLLFTILTSNPFARHVPALADGNDLNPILQDPGLIMHPPMLYTGYVGFSVAFAFAIAALLGGELDVAWVRWARPWTNVAWAFLTFGIALGSWWAYYVLGWGGWWFWDPVENASFMPWLVGTALIHSQAVTEKRGSFRAWTLLLSIFAFSLSLLGTFLVRSGVLTSVHAFASDPKRGLFILAFLSVVVGGSLLIHALRAPKVAGGKPFKLLSRETLLLINNLLFTCAAAMVLLGTLYPLIGDALGVGRISVGPPYFGFMFVLLMAPIVLLVPLGPFFRWASADWRATWRALRPALILALAAVVVAKFWFPSLSWRGLAGVAAALWAGAGIILYAAMRWRNCAARRALHAGDARHDLRALRRRSVPRRRADHRSEQRRERPALRAERNEDRRRTRLPLPRRRACARPELRRRPGHGRSPARRHGHCDVASAETSVLRWRPGADQVRYRSGSIPRSIRRARRTAAGWRLGRARLRQAVRALDLAWWLVHDVRRACRCD